VAIAVLGVLLQGYLCNMELEREIWSRAIRTLLRKTPSECGLLISEPLFNFEEVRASTLQVRGERADCGAHDRPRGLHRCRQLPRRYHVS
jgi:hypothetical protein